METPVTLSSATIDPATGLARVSPRPPHLRDARYDAGFDWHTLAYDCYRSGDHVVLQGPPFLNLLAPLLTSAPFPRWLRAPRAVTMHKRGEIWWRTTAETLNIDGPIGRYSLAVQPDMAELFAGRRVITTLSKDNAPRWIADWVQFYAREHGADGVLIYDNGSNAYSAAALGADLRARFPDLVIVVVSWPFLYGPQGGQAGAVKGVETPWDSDFCQTGSLQHARHRFLRLARAVLNVDIDELLPAGAGETIFAATERSRARLIRFAGHWISGACPAVPAEPRHGDFIWRDAAETRVCPPKWCLVPAAHDPRRTSWSVHNLFGSRHNAQLSDAHVYRHFTAISNSWKEDRRIGARFDAARHHPDRPIAEALTRAGLATAIGQVA